MPCKMVGALLTSRLGGFLQISVGAEAFSSMLIVTVMIVVQLQKGADFGRASV